MNILNEKSIGTTFLNDDTNHTSQHVVIGPPRHGMSVLSGIILIRNLITEPKKDGLL